MDQANGGHPKAIPERIEPKGSSPAPRLCQQLDFLAELDRLKSVVRQSPLAESQPPRNIQRNTRGTSPCSPSP